MAGTFILLGFFFTKNVGRFLTSPHKFTEFRSGLGAPQIGRPWVLGGQGHSKLIPYHKQRYFCNCTFARKTLKTGAAHPFKRAAITNAHRPPFNCTASFSRSDNQTDLTVKGGKPLCLFTLVPNLTASAHILTTNTENQRSPAFLA